MLSCVQKQPLATVSRRASIFGRVPEAAEIPIVVAKVVDAFENLAARYCAFIVDDGSRASGPALQLRTAFQSRLRDELVHVDVDCGFEESGIAGVVVLDGRVPRILADTMHERVIARLVDDAVPSAAPKAAECS